MGLQAPPSLWSIPLPNLQISSFGIITKNAQHSKCIWSSINDGFNPEFSLVIKLGPGALMAKFDVKTAYHNIAVHPRLMIEYILVLKSHGQSWQSKGWCTRRQLESLIGRLNQGHQVLGKPWGGLFDPSPTLFGGLPLSGLSWIPFGFSLIASWLHLL